MDGGTLNPQDLVKSCSIDDLINMRAGVAERVRQAVALLEEARVMAARGNLGWRPIVVEASGGQRFTLEEKTILDEVDAGGWGYLMRESGLRTFMDRTARKEWDDSIYKAQVPELTREVVDATFRDLFATRQLMFDRGVIACFRKLSWDFKSNLPHKFGKKIILNHLAISCRLYFHFSHSTCDELDDLDRAFHVMDHQREPDHRDGWFKRLCKFDREPCTVESDYMAVRWYCKGTGHAVFKRPDLVERMNEILSRTYPDALPPPDRTRVWKA